MSESHQQKHDVNWKAHFIWQSLLWLYLGKNWREKKR